MARRGSRHAAAASLARWLLLLPASLALRLPPPPASPPALRAAPSPRLAAPLALHSPLPPPPAPSDLPPPLHPPPSTWPVRTMVFIDGTWLYYSLYGRRPGCPLSKRFGSDWSYKYRIAFEQLPAMIAAALSRQLHAHSAVPRFVEVVRTIVFTSARADTYVHSHRLRMFAQMEEANYEVHMRTTTGTQEKCVDIALAVEMMHYASIEGACDCSVLVTGDKDFIPVMSRIRQKGKRVALCSMRNCCSRDLIEPSSHARDFHPIWLEDALDQLVLPNTRLSGVDGLSVSQLMPLIVSYLSSQPAKSASSRDIGRYLQTQPGKNEAKSALETLKQRHFSLRAFLLEYPAWFEVNKQDGFEFSVRLLEEEAEDERLIDAKIGRTTALDGLLEEGGGGRLGAGEEELSEGEALWLTLRSRTVAQLRDELRARGLPHTGRKSELVERLHAAAGAGEVDGELLGRKAGGEEEEEEEEEEEGEEEEEEEEEEAARGGVDDDHELIVAVREYLKNAGSVASSRDVGRHLAALGQLQRLKKLYSGLFHFLQHHHQLFRIELPEDRSTLEYRVHLKGAAPPPRAAPAAPPVSVRTEG